MFIVEYIKAQQCCIQKLNLSFLFDMYQSMVIYEHQYVTKMTLNVSMGGLWGDFIVIFWITEYLQRHVAEHRVTEQELCGCAICVNTSITDQG